MVMVLHYRKAQNNFLMICEDFQFSVEEKIAGLAGDGGQQPVWRPLG
jgi:hypothetical protein